MASIFCVNKSKLSSLDGTFSNIQQRTKKSKSDGISSIFQCTNGSLISPKLLCDKNRDCRENDDEALCTSVQEGLSVEQWLRQSQDFSPHKASDHQKASIWFSCKSTEILCIYSIAPHDRNLQFCPDGQHLGNCETFNCEVIKCPGYYCLP